MGQLQLNLAHNHLWLFFYHKNDKHGPLYMGTWRLHDKFFKFTLIFFTVSKYIFLPAWLLLGTAAQMIDEAHGPLVLQYTSLTQFHNIFVVVLSATLLHVNYISIVLSLFTHTDTPLWQVPRKDYNHPKVSESCINPIFIFL